MPGWKELVSEVHASGSMWDVVRRRYLVAVSEHTKRNVIVYYSGWLEKPDLANDAAVDLYLSDADKSGFMSTIHQLDRGKGLDLVLHTPGGDIAATESLVDYLRSMFGRDIRVIVPQLALSAGTMIACSSREIIMGKHSSLGPIDPQIGPIPAHGIIEEFDRARGEINANPRNAQLWAPILSQYSPALVGECEKAIEWSAEMVRSWLLTNMFLEEPRADETVRTIMDEIASHAMTKSHARHISMEKIRAIGLKVRPLEDDPKLQELVLSLHHACILTLQHTGVFKLIENQLGVAFVRGVDPQAR